MSEKNKKILIIAMAIFSSLMLLSFLTIFAGTKYYTNKSIPTQFYLSNSLSGVSPSNLAASIDKANLKLSQKSINFSLDQEVKDIFLQEFDPNFDNSSLIKEVKFYKGTPTMSQLIRDIFSFENYDPSYSIDQTKISEVLITKFNGLYKSQNAFFESPDKIKPESKGVLPDVDPILASLLSDRPSSIQIQTIIEEPTITESTISNYTENISFLGDNPLLIKHEDKEFQLALFDNIQNIKFVGTPEELSIKLEDDFVSEFIHYTIQPEVKEEPTPLKISLSQDSSKAEFSDDFKQGVDVDKQALLDLINSTLSKSFQNKSKQEITVITKPIESPLEIDPSLKQQGVKELVGTGYTTFRGSTRNRIHNINVGVERFNGTIIPKGEEFSFNTNLGPVDGSTGYKPELVIKSFGTIPEYGGGLCQVSSTMYRAALFSGLEITERSNHSYAVDYYAQVLGHGLDATIYPGVKDLKFKNNTDGDIVVHAFTNGTEATFNFYGTKMIDKVELVDYQNSNYRSPGPKKITVDPSLPSGTIKYLDSPVTGFDSYWKRVIHYKDGEIKEEDIFSKYRAVNAKWVVPSDYGVAQEDDSAEPAES